MLEAALENYFRKTINEHGGMPIKVVPTQAGLPDRIVLFNGHTYWVELKTEKGRLSNIQKHQHRAMAKHGSTVTTLYGREEVDRWVADTLGPEEPFDPQPFEGGKSIRLRAAIMRWGDLKDQILKAESPQDEAALVARTLDNDLDALVAGAHLDTSWCTTEEESTEALRLYRQGFRNAMFGAEGDPILNGVATDLAQALPEDGTRQAFTEARRAA